MSTTTLRLSPLPNHYLPTKVDKLPSEEKVFNIAANSKIWLYEAPFHNDHHVFWEFKEDDDLEERFDRGRTFYYKYKFEETAALLIIFKYENIIMPESILDQIERYKIMQVTENIIYLVDMEDVLEELMNYTIALKLKRVEKRRSN